MAYPEFMKTNLAAHLGRWRLMRRGILLVLGIAAVLTALASVAQVIPAATATNVASLITSAGAGLTSEGFISFSAANSAMNHDRELDAWNREGAALTSEAARELESKCAANPKDQPSLVRLLSYHLIHYEFDDPGHGSAEQVGRLYANFIELDPYSKMANAISISRLSPILADPKCFEIVAGKWIGLAQQHTNNPHIIRQAGTFLMLSPVDKAFIKKGESLLRQLAERDPDSALSYGNSCLDQSGPCFDRPEGDRGLAAKALGALQTAERLLPPERKEQVQLDLLSSITKAAFWAGEYSIAEKYADRWLAVARQRSDASTDLPPDQRLAREWDLGDAVHQANSILGEIALSRGDTKRAGECLIASGKVTKASPALGSYGPDLALMRDLLGLKQTQPVLDFLDECTKFWKTSQAQPVKWKKAIQSGKEPDLGAGFTTRFKRLK